jgi:hypothetical protein
MCAGPIARLWDSHTFEFISTLLKPFVPHISREIAETRPLANRPSQFDPLFFGREFVQMSKARIRNHSSKDTFSATAKSDDDCPEAPPCYPDDDPPRSAVSWDSPWGFDCRSNILLGAAILWVVLGILTFSIGAGGHARAKAAKPDSEFMKPAAILIVAHFG